MFELVLNMSLRSEWFFSQIITKWNSWNLQNSERSDSLRNLLLKVTKLQYRIENNNVNILQFSGSRLQLW